VAEAIAGVRAAAADGAQRRRREALERLARILEATGAGPADSARALAWARPAPSPEAMETVAAEAERLESGT
jgi:hypothetical protein